MSLLPTTDLPTVYLKPGELYVGDKPTLVITILGSCVSVVLFNRRTSVGAICHALLPSGVCAREESFRYVDCSVRHMLKELGRRGVNLGEIEAKLFGGSDILATIKGDGVRKTIGQQNIEAAVLAVREMGMRLVASDMGGVSGRKIFFYTHTGEVLVKRHRRIAILQQE